MAVNEEPQECVAEVVDDAELRPLDRPNLPARRGNAEPVRVKVLQETDYVWNEELKAFYPVFESTHGQREIDARQRELSTSRPRKLFDRVTKKLGG